MWRCSIVRLRGPSHGDKFFFCTDVSLYYRKGLECRRMFPKFIEADGEGYEWVIVEDGPLTDELYDLLEQYQRQYAGLIKRVPLIENQGLGAALRVGIPECNYELIARMDTDDIARRDRFEKQIAEFENNPNLDVCGSQIDEFEETPDKIIARRSVLLEHNDIVQYLKRRDAFIHVTVMFKKRAA